MKSSSTKGGRPATGSLRWKNGQWWARISLPNGSRPWVELDPAITERDEDAARECAREVSALARATGAVPVTVRETFREYAERWLNEREKRGLTSVHSDRYRMRMHVFAVLGDIDVRRIGRTDVERLVRELDRKIASPADDAQHIAWKTAMNIWGLVTKLFDDAVHAKRLDLRVRDDDPTDKVRGPERGARKAKQFLYPSEFLKLVAAPDEKVPLHRRVLYAVAVYTFARAGELRALTWDDVDFEHRVIHITKAVDRHTGKVKSTKTGETRRIPIEPNVVALLESLKERATQKRCFALPPARKLALLVRDDLEAAGVSRAELFAGDETRKALTFHDLRATGITWMAVRGDEPLRIKQRAGHASFSTTEGYIREAENLIAMFGEVFPKLPADLIERLDGVSSPVSSRDKTSEQNPGEKQDSWRREGDSNPWYPCGHT